MGAQYYALRPLYPFSRTLANINMDGFFPFGRTKDVINFTAGYSTLDEVVNQVASAQGRVVKPDFLPSGGMLYRSDHFEFAKDGSQAWNLSDSPKPGASAHIDNSSDVVDSRRRGIGFAV